MIEKGGDPLISVIIPVHNGERYLEQCLDSAIAQSLSEIEVIVVDDASTDRTPEILGRFAEADDRLRVITHPRNFGVSAARNAGIDRARGRFIAFVDADDYVDLTMLEELHRASQEEQVDVISCGITLVDEDGRVLETVDFPLPAEIRHDHSDIQEALLGAFRSKLLWYPFRSLYSRSLLIEHKLRFDEEIRKGEDSLFNLQALFFADGVAVIGVAPYHYRKHPGSATAKPLPSERDNIERLAQQVMAFYQAHSFGTRAYVDFFEQVLRSDLPTSFVRLRSSPEIGAQVRSLVNSPTVRKAFGEVTLRDLDVPFRIKLLLGLARLRAVAPLLAVLRASSFLQKRWRR